jgi:hypothetical protein
LIEESPGSQPATDHVLAEVGAQRGDLVDLVGIEPTTSSMPWKRAPSCATGPHFGNGVPNGVSEQENCRNKRLTINSRPPFPLRQTHLGYGSESKVRNRSPHVELAEGFVSSL